VKKTSIYLDEGDVQRLRRLSEMECRSQALIIREAIATYEAIRKPDRRFALAGAWEGDGSSVADVSEAELLHGFGE
jgi:predicted transcriptional regulator